MLSKFRIAVGLAVVAGAGIGSFYITRAFEDGGSPAQQTLAISPTATATPLPTNTPEPTATVATMVPPSPTAQAAAPTALPTKIPLQPRRDIPTAAEIMVDANGKYFIPDRGDGCPWFERARATLNVPNYETLTVEPKMPPVLTLVAFGTPCEADFFWVYSVETGEVRLVLP
ncbi:MAG TPA: hypothetical protein VNM43_08835 [Dehalococcoidia bacterium]|nr:hypothetical protein [Dehalococcoidia bacterium]